MPGKTLGTIANLAGIKECCGRCREEERQRRRPKGGSGRRRKKERESRKRERERAREANKEVEIGSVSRRHTIHALNAFWI